MRWGWWLCVLVGCAAPAVRGGRRAAAPAPRAEATCEAPAPLPLGVSVVGSTRGARSRLGASCVRGGAPELVYRVELTERSALRVDVHADDFDPALYLLSDCTSARSELACNDDQPRDQPHHARVEATLPPGGYLVVVDSAADESGTFELFARAAPVAGVSAACRAARPLESGQVVRGDNTGRVNTFQGTCAAGARGAEQIFRLAVERPSRLRLWQQTEYDGALYLRASCADPSSELACNDDFRDPRHALLTVRLAPGEYYVFTDSLETRQQGRYALAAELAPEPGNVPSQQARCERVQRQLRSGGSVELDTLRAPDSFAGSCGGEGAPDEVFGLRVEQPSRLWAHLREPEFEGVLSLRRGCADPASEVACERQLAFERQPARAGSPPIGLNTVVPPGDYTLIVDGAHAQDFGAARLEIQTTPVRSLRTLCRKAPVLRPGQTVRGDTSGARDDFRASCAAEAQSGDDPYRLRIDRAGRYRLDLEAGYDAALHLREGCADVLSELACNDDGPRELTSRIDADLRPGEYLLVVDGFGLERTGAYELRVEALTGP